MWGNFISFVLEFFGIYFVEIFEDVGFKYFRMDFGYIVYSVGFNNVQMGYVDGFFIFFFNYGYFFFLIYVFGLFFFYVV